MDRFGMDSSEDTHQPTSEQATDKEIKIIKLALTIMATDAR
jgi:hypothetical protein